MHTFMFLLLAFILFLDIFFFRFSLPSRILLEKEKFLKLVFFLSLVVFPTLYT